MKPIIDPNRLYVCAYVCVLVFGRFIAKAVYCRVGYYKLNILLELSRKQGQKEGNILVIPCIYKCKCNFVEHLNWKISFRVNVT